MQNNRLLRVIVFQTLLQHLQNLNASVFSIKVLNQVK